MRYVSEKSILQLEYELRTGSMFTSEHNLLISREKLLAECKELPDKELRNIIEERLKAYLSRVNKESSDSDKSTYYYKGHVDAIHAILDMVEELPNET